MNNLFIIDFFINNILMKPEIFIGLLVFIGYIFLKKPIYEAFAGFIKATVGYMILNVGAGGLISHFRPILIGLNDKFQLNASVIDPYFGLNAVNSALETIKLNTSWTVISLLIGFVFNIILVFFKKYTKIRTLFITGHVMVQQSTTATWIIFFLFPQYRNIVGAILIGIFVGTYWAVSTNLIVEATSNITGERNFTVGNHQMFTIWLTDRISSKIGDSKVTFENLKIPKCLTIFRENIVSTSILMIFFMGTIILILGEDYMRNIDIINFPTTTNFYVYIFLKSLYFSVFLSVLMMGVNLFVEELSNSFKGISEKILPGVIPAIDCAAIFKYSDPNAILLGFFFGALGQFLAILMLLIFKSPILIITGFIPVFFDNATLAIFAEKKGGIKAATIITFFSGTLQVFLGALAVALFKLQGYGGWHGNIDQSSVWLFEGFFMKYLGLIGYIICIVSMLIIPLLQYKTSKKRNEYF